jgi:hypothetical protein
MNCVGCFAGIFLFVVAINLCFDFVRSSRSSEFGVILMFVPLSFVRTVCQITWLLYNGPGSSCQLAAFTHAQQQTVRISKLNPTSGIPGRHLRVLARTSQGC